MQERISIQLKERGEAQVVERGKWSIVEGTGEAQDLVRLGVIKVRKAANVVLVEPRTLVGSFLSPTTHILISPKRPEFLAILKRASNRWRRYAPVSDERLVGRLESYVGLGRKFRDLLLDLTNEGAPWSYSRKVFATSMPNGRILFNKSVAKLHSRGISHRVIVSTPEKRHEHRLASVLQTVLRAVESTEPVAAQDKSEATFLIDVLGQALEYVTEGEASQILTELRFDFPDRPVLQSVAEFSLAVLGGDEPYRISQQVGRGVAEFVDMEKLWEDAVAEIARAHGPSPALSYRLHPLRGAQLTLMTDGGPRLDPDIVAYEGATANIVIDAKYSLATAADAGDVYQISSYVSRMGASVGILAYVAPGELTGSHLIGTLENGAKVLFWSLGADVFDTLDGAMYDMLFRSQS